MSSYLHFTYCQQNLFVHLREITCVLQELNLPHERALQSQY